MTARGVLAIASGKGGVGKTTTSINLAAALALDRHAVVVVEADLKLANIAEFLDLPIDQAADPTLHDVLADRAAIEEAIYPAPGGFDVVPGSVSLDAISDTDPTGLEGVIASLERDYEYVLLDTGAGLRYGTLLPLALADGIVLISTPRVASIRDTKKTLGLAETVGTPTIGVLFMRSGTGSAPPPERLAAFIGVDLLGHIPADETVQVAQDAGEPVIRYDATSPAARAYRETGMRVETAVKQLGQNDDGFLSRLRSHFPDPTTSESGT